MYDQIRDGFAVEEADAVQVVTPGGGAGVSPYAADLSRIDGVVRVDSAAGSYSGGERAPAPRGASFTAKDGGGGRLTVTPPPTGSSPIPAAWSATSAR